MPAWLEMWCHSGGNGLSTPRSLVTTAYPEGYLVSNRTDGFAAVAVFPQSTMTSRLVIKSCRSTHGHLGGPTTSFSGTAAVRGLPLRN